MNAADLSPDQVVKTTSGRSLTFIAHVPLANPDCRAVFLDKSCGEIVTYWEDGSFLQDRRTSPWDIAE